MKRSCKHLFIIIFILECLLRSEANQPECSGVARKKHRVAISIDNKRSQAGEWVTVFSASQNTSTLPQNVILDLSRSVVECHDNHFISIHGTIRDSVQENQTDSLHFHNRCSVNAAITNNGRTLQKIKATETAAALTSRALLDDEVFTIRLDRRGTNVNHALGIGITTLSPATLDVPNHINSLKSGIWMFYHTNLYKNSQVTVQDFFVSSLDNLKVGQRIGVMRSKSGTLHLFLDGVDQGPAASNIPDIVYGVFELYGAGLQGTIVDA